MDYITTKQLSKNWKTAYIMAMCHCSAGKIKLAKKMEIHTLLLLTDDIGTGL
ncbi:hypothetical protein NYR90_12240 [Clostridioides difficile]|nr:hypothetical protein NYR90_12240 [Clostridioides difficile]